MKYAGGKAIAKWKWTISKISVAKGWHGKLIPLPSGLPSTIMLAVTEIWERYSTEYQKAMLIWKDFFLINKDVIKVIQKTIFKLLHKNTLPPWLIYIFLPNIFTFVVWNLIWMQLSSYLRKLDFFMLNIQQQVKLFVLYSVSLSASESLQLH